MNHRDGKRGTRAHEVAVNDEQTNRDAAGTSPLKHTSVFKNEVFEQKPFLLKETPEPCGVWSLPQFVLCHTVQLTLPRQEIFQVIIKSQLHLFFFFF